MFEYHYPVQWIFRFFLMRLQVMTQNNSFLDAINQEAMKNRTDPHL